MPIEKFRNKKFILLISLAGLAVLSLVYGIVKPPPREQKPSPPSAAPALEVKVSPEPFLAEERGFKRSAFPTWGRSPFLPPQAETPSVGSLVLNGIAWDEKNPRAVINDRIVGVGDRIRGNRVVAIKKDRVILNDGFSTFELRLGRKR